MGNGAAPTTAYGCVVMLHSDGSEEHTDPDCDAPLEFHRSFDSCEYECDCRRHYGMPK